MVRTVARVRRAGRSLPNVLNTPGQDDEDGELDLDFEGLLDEETGDDCLPLDDEREQVGFELFDWTAVMLDTLDDELHARGLPHEWVSDGFEVVVHDDDENIVESLIGELVAPFIGDVTDADAAAEVVAAVAAEAAATNEASERDETPVGTVDDLFQAVSRMRRKTEGDVRLAFLDAADQLGQDPPFGVDPAVWANVLRAVDDLLDAFTEGSAERVVRDRVEALRTRLRPLI